MKKLSLALALAAAVSFANADIFSISAGAGYEHQKIGGYVQSDKTKNYFGVKSVNPATNPNVGYFGLQNKNNPYFWIKVIHPIPFIPNFKFQYTKYDSTGHSNYIASDFKIFGGVNINTVLTNADTSLKINSYDLTLFYEFKPAVADIELGAGADYWKGTFKIYDNTLNKYVVDSSWSVVLPYLYANVETMKFFGFSLLGYVKWAKAGSDHHYEYLGALKYTIDVPGPVNPFVKVGYKYKDAYGTSGEYITDLKYQGAFLEIGAKF
jgi:outer membrane protein